MFQSIPLWKDTGVVAMSRLPWILKRMCGAETKIIVSFPWGLCPEAGPMHPWGAQRVLCSVTPRKHFPGVRCMRLIPQHCALKNAGFTQHVPITTYWLRSIKIPGKSGTLNGTMTLCSNLSTSVLSFCASFIYQLYFWKAFLKTQLI